MVKLMQTLQENADASDLESNDSLVKEMTRIKLQKLARHLELGVKYNAKKAVYFEEVVMFLSEKDLLSEDFVETLEDSEKELTETSFLSVADNLEIIEAKAKVERERLVLETKAEKERQKVRKKDLF